LFYILGAERLPSLRIPYAFNNKHQFFRNAKSTKYHLINGFSFKKRHFVRP